MTDTELKECVLVLSRGVQLPLSVQRWLLAEVIRLRAEAERKAP